MKVKIKKNSKAVIPFKTHQEDFCYDCVAISCEELAPNVYKYDLGFALQIEPTANISFDLRPRSSIWKTGMVLSNSTGTIDSLFTGNISVVFYHLFPNMPKYEVGDKVCQLKVGITEEIEFEEVEELSETSRGNGGYGSTGK